MLVKGIIQGNIPPLKGPHVADFHLNSCIQKENAKNSITGSTLLARHLLMFGSNEFMRRSVIGGKGQEPIKKQDNRVTRSPQES